MMNVSTCQALPFGNEKRMLARVATFWNRVSDGWREHWGPHIHLGYCQTAADTPGQAQETLISRLVGFTGLEAGNEVVLDAGCGMGETAVRLRKTVARRVVGVTLSRRQADIATATARDSGVTDVDFRVDDALYLRSLADADRFTLVWSLESCEQFFDKPRFLRRAFSVLEPGGKLMLATWCSDRDLYEGRAARQYVALCRAFHLPYMPTIRYYEQALAEAGFRVLKAQDWSKETRATWTYGWKHIRAMGILKVARAAGLPGLRFMWNLAGMERAWRDGLVRYGIFLAQRPE